MSNQGFIKIDRGIVDHWVFKDPYLRMWIYLIKIASFEDSKKPVEIVIIERKLVRGEFMTSMKAIQNKLDLPFKDVRRCLDKFKKNNMIVKTSGRGKNIPYVAKIVNYDKWQGNYTFKPHSSNIHKSFKSQHNNNYKNYNNGNNENRKWIYQCEVCEKQETAEIHDLQITCCNQDMVRNSV